MTTSFVDIVAVPVTGLTTLVTTPASVEIGDLIYAMVLCDTTATLTLPSIEWKPHSTFTIDTFKGLTAFRYADESGSQSLSFTLDVFTAPRYIVLVVYRATVRDFNFNIISYPYGFFAPGGSVGATQTGTSNTLASVNGANPTTVPDFVRVLYFFIQHDIALGSPMLDDVSPLEAIRARALTNRFGIEVVDVEYEDPISPAPLLTVRSSLVKPWTVFSVAIESLDAAIGTQDNYKSKVLRGMWPPPYDNRLSSNLGKLLTVIGSSDNDLGGLFGDDDFLPNEEP